MVLAVLGWMVILAILNAAGTRVLTCLMQIHMTSFHPSYPSYRRTLSKPSWSHKVHWLNRTVITLLRVSAGFPLTHLFHHMGVKYGEVQGGDFFFNGGVRNNLTESCSN